MSIVLRERTGENMLAIVLAHQSILTLSRHHSTEENEVDQISSLIIQDQIAYIGPP